MHTMESEPNTSTMDTTADTMDTITEMDTVDKPQHALQGSKTLRSCLLHMLEQEIDCDVTFQVHSEDGCPREIKAHKMILCARSAVFEAMFSGSFLESNGVIVIKDLETDIVEELLRYMYTDEVRLTHDNLFPLYQAANKYLLERLAAKCLRFLSRSLCSVSACSTLKHSLLYPQSEMADVCLNFIACNITDVMKTDAFFDLSQQELLGILKYDRIPYVAEADLYGGCLEWAKRRAQDPVNPKDEEIREILGECIYQIRFPYVPVKDFVEKFGESKVLDDTEKSLILCSGISHQQAYNDSLIRCGFSVVSRVIALSRYFHYCPTAYKISVNGTVTEAFSIWMDKPIQIMGVSILGGKPGFEFDVAVCIQNPKNAQENATTVQSVVSTGDRNPIPVYFKPVPTQVKTRYKVVVTLKGFGHVGYGFELKASSKEHSTTFSTTGKSFPYSLHHQAGGFVAQLLFQRLL